MSMRPGGTHIWSELLEDARERRYMTQQDVASAIGEANPKTVSRWERGGALPSPYYQQQLCKLFGKRTEELGFSRKAFPPHWSVPVSRSPFFTGRDALLERLHTRFEASSKLKLEQPFALSGLAGIGKTLVAIEYAHRFRYAYHTVLWIRAESEKSIQADLAACALILKLDVPKSKGHQAAIDAVLAWLAKYSYWLLIFDNVVELRTIQPFLPHQIRGHVLLTTQASSTGGLAQSIPVEPLSQEDGVRLLLNRSKTAQAATDADWEAARTLVGEMGGLPLALDQVGAFIEQSQRSVSDYLPLYYKYGVKLLRERDTLDTHVHESVLTTFDLTLDEIRKQNQTAIDLLQLFAFLDPDAIPEAVISDANGVSDSLLSPVVLNDLERQMAFNDLFKFSLLRRTPGMDSLSIHRILQVVVKGKMNAAEQRHWAELAVRAISRVFPDVVMTSVAHWPLCERYLVSAQICATLIQENNMRFIEAARLVEQLGVYLQQRLRFAEAETLLRQALEIREELVGKDHIDVAVTLGFLGLCYYYQYDNARAEELFQRVLHINERVYGENAWQAVQPLLWIANLYRNMDNYALAIWYYLKAQNIAEKAPDHPQLGGVLNGLGRSYYKLKNFEKAEQLFGRALDLYRERFGPDHPLVAVVLDNLAEVYSEQGKFAEADLLMHQALTLREQTLGKLDVAVADSLLSLAKHYRRQGKYHEAIEFFSQTIRITEQVNGAESPMLDEVLPEYGETLRVVGRDSEAVAVEERMMANRAKRADSSYELKPTSRSQLENASIDRFLEARAELSPQAASRLADLWNAYREWVQETEERYVVSTVQIFAKYLLVKGCVRHHTRTRREWLGIRLRIDTIVTHESTR